jgi:hypothetical protein
MPATNGPIVPDCPPTREEEAFGREEEETWQPGPDRYARHTPDKQSGHIGCANHAEAA